MTVSAKCSTEIAKDSHLEDGKSGKFSVNNLEKSVKITSIGDQFDHVLLPIDGEHVCALKMV